MALGSPNQPKVKFLELMLDPEGAEYISSQLNNESAISLASVLPQLTKLFALKTEDAPGLAFVGAQASGNLNTIAAEDPIVFGCAGSGSELSHALVSCIGEAVERVSQVDQGHIPFETMNFETGIVGWPSTWLDELEQNRMLAKLRGQEVDWITGHLFLGNQPIRLPADWCLRRAGPGPMAIAGATMSTGVAAGQSFKAAIRNAILELVERDAAALWWIGGARPRTIALEGHELPKLTKLVQDLRGGCSSRTSWFLDITTDLMIPVVAAVSVNQSGKGFSCGLGAGLSLAEAAERAFFELLQMELGLRLAEMKTRDPSVGTITEIDERALVRASAIDANECDLILPARAPLALDSFEQLAAEKDPVVALRRRFHEVCIDFGVVDLTHPNLGVPVAMAISRDLQLLSESFATTRLTNTIAETGGGRRWTRDSQIF